MATPITLVQATPDGVAAPAEAAADATNGNSIPRGSLLILRNSDTVAHNVTFDTPAQVDGYDVAQKTVSLAAGATRHFGGWPRDAFGATVAFTADSALVMVAAFA